jgi:UDP-N-acetylmuramate-alanine ligase
MEPLGTRDGVRVFDDFGGKHPANVRAGIEALRRHFPGAAITAVFEPYGPYLPRWGRRYARSLSGADRVVIAPAAYVADYPAGPPVDPRWTEACGVEPVLVVDRHEAAVSAMSGCRPGDVVVVFAQVRAGRLTAELAVGGQAT